MLPNYRRILLQRAARLFDLAAVTLTFLSALAISSGSLTWSSLENVLLMRIKVVNTFLFAGYLALCSAIFLRCGFYVSHRLSYWTRQVREIFTATTLTAATIFLLRWAFQLEFATNEFLLFYWLQLFIGLLLARMVGRQLLSYFRTRGKNLRSLVIIGEGLEAGALADRIETEASLGYRVVGVIDAKEGLRNERVANTR
jgi:FlaA1/EpsC-like NDP-sugar epimerase